MAIETSIHRGASGSQADSRHRRWLIAALKLAVSVGAIVAVFWAVDLRAALDQFTRQNHALIAFAILAMFAQLFFGALRWHFIRTGLGIRTTVVETLQTSYVGSFFSTYIWSAVSGDIMRGWLAYRSGASMTVAVNSVLLDRVVLILGLALLIAFATPWFFMRLHTGAAGWLPATFAAVLILGVLIAGQVHRLPERWRSFWAVKPVATLCAAVRDVLMHPAYAIPSIGCAMIAQTLLAVTTFALAKSLGVNVTLLDLVVIMQVVALINAVPISVGGWGVREASMVGLLGLIGVPASTALLLSVQLGLVGLIVNLPGGLVWLQLRSERARQTNRAEGFKA